MGPLDDDPGSGTPKSVECDGLAEGDYFVEEDLPDGWELVLIYCDGAEESDVDIDEDYGNVTIDLVAVKTSRAFFNNEIEAEEQEEPEEEPERKTTTNCHCRSWLRLLSDSVRDSNGVTYSPTQTFPTQTPVAEVLSARPSPPSAGDGGLLGQGEKSGIPYLASGVG